MVEEKICISCGMPMKESKDFPLEDASKDYCVYCARADGSLKSFEEALQGMKQFLIHTYNMDVDDAGKKANEHLKNNPAWKDS